MSTTMKFSTICFVAYLCLGWVTSSALDSEEKPFISSQFETAADDGMMNNALINYLLARQAISKMKSAPILDQQKKRTSYWKQCAFNAVSCFGKK